VFDENCFIILVLNFNISGCLQSNSLQGDDSSGCELQRRRLITASHFEWYCNIHCTFIDNIHATYFRKFRTPYSSNPIGILSRKKKHKKANRPINYVADCTIFFIRKLNYKDNILLKFPNRHIIPKYRNRDRMIYYKKSEPVHTYISTNKYT